jgi:precorrin-6A/cobalt-precorrin-6A reductase
MTRHLLILGGTTESRQLAASLAGRDDLSVTLSLAGRTTAPLAQPVPTRSGGFGGVAGLATYLREHRIDVLIDATHPYAEIISANALQAASLTSTPLLTLRRPPWQAVPGDRWTQVADAEAAAQALGSESRSVFLAVGRQEVAAFDSQPQHRYVIRTVDPVDPPLCVPHVKYILARGPFSEAEDRELLSSNAIDVVVAKNSGGEATYGKIAAARTLGIRVVLLQRPFEHAGPSVSTVADAVAWLHHVLAPGMDRGV